jgi:hypothetical protein
LGHAAWAKFYYNLYGIRVASHTAHTQWFWSNGTIVAAGALWADFQTIALWWWENPSRWWNFVAPNLAQANDEVTFKSGIPSPWGPIIVIENFVSRIITTVNGWGNSWAH